mgnify:FL=1
MANKAAVRVKGVECSRMKLMILSRLIIFITNMLSITALINFIRARIALLWLILWIKDYYYELRLRIT